MRLVTCILIPTLLGMKSLNPLLRLVKVAVIMAGTELVTMKNLFDKESDAVGTGAVSLFFH